MPEEGPYEIMPYKEIVALKKEIAELKSKSGASSQDLLNSINNLTKSMNGMLELFSAAAEEMKLEEKSETGIAEKIDPLMDKLNETTEQNKTIAEGMVAIADMIKEMKEKKEEPVIKPKPTPKEPILPEYHPKPGPLPPLQPAPGSELPPLPGEEMPGPLPAVEDMPPPGPMPPPRPPPNIPAGPLAGGPMPLGPMPEEKPKRRGLFRRR